jgi:Spy/CpxP family protein refolding chaperone
MKKTLLLIAVLTLTTMALAQDPGPGPMPGPMARHMGPGPDGMGPMPPLRGFGGSWWKNSAVAEKLKLTDQQKQQLEKTFLDYRLKLVDLRADVQREELKLQPLMDADQLNETQISSQLDALLAARMKLEKTNAMMYVSMRKVLTAEQWKELRSMRAERFRTAREKRGEMGHRRSGRPATGDQPAPPPAAPGAPPAAPPSPQED